MRQTKILMGMPITVEIAQANAKQKHIERVFRYFDYVDGKFSTFKDSSEITQINKGHITLAESSEDVKEVLELSEKTKRETRGYFDIQTPQNNYDPSGLVKGWAINNAAKLLRDLGYENFYINAGGDAQTSGLNANNRPWQVGIRHPFKKTEEVVKVISVSGQGVATSGSYVRGRHIYNPHNKYEAPCDIVSLTVIGSNIYEADRFATAAFAMGREGISFLESLAGFEGYMIDKHGVATMTSLFEKYLQ